MTAVNSALPDGAAKLPRHLAVIMDGNGRWAQARGQMRLKGHQAGAQAVRTVIKAALMRGIPILTLYAFSSENWKRPAAEVNGLMTLLARALKEHAAELHQHQVKIRIVGDVSALSTPLQRTIARVEELTSQNHGMTLNIAINYGARPEITAALRKLIQQVQDGRLDLSALSEADISAALYVPQDVDLLIRTGGEFRLSNFLLWQCAYAEIYVSRVLWPDFDEIELDKALHFFAGRERRFGMTSAQLAQAASGAVDLTQP